MTDLRIILAATVLFVAVWIVAMIVDPPRPDHKYMQISIGG
jgi:hypothetical protein